MFKSGPFNPPYAAKPDTANATETWSIHHLQRGQIEAPNCRVDTLHNVVV